MKKSILTPLLATLCLLGTSLPAAAQLRFGPRVGMTINDIEFSDKIVEVDNRNGWTAGLSADLSLPILGFGLDLSAMYVRRDSRFLIPYLETDGMPSQGTPAIHATTPRDYIEIPANIKYSLDIPGLNELVVPYIALGPSVAFLANRQALDNAYYHQSVVWGANGNIGIRLFEHLDIRLRYCRSLSRAMKIAGERLGTPLPDAPVTDSPTVPDIYGKDRTIALTVAYLF